MDQRRGKVAALAIPEAPLVRVVPVLALLTAALCACKAPPSKTDQASASSAPAPASSAPAAPAAPPEPAHNWAYRQGDDYAYLTGTAPVGEQEQPTMVRYLGVQDGVYTIVETQQGAVVGASCAKPCDKVRLRGKGLDRTLALNPNSTVFAALSDAMNGQLEVYQVKGAEAR
jgi:hypothetical protein